MKGLRDANCPSDKADGAHTALGTIVLQLSQLHYDSVAQNALDSLEFRAREAMHHVCCSPMPSAFIILGGL
jgi:hypothetical protein